MHVLFTEKHETYYLIMRLAVTRNAVQWPRRALLHVQYAAQQPGGDQKYGHRSVCHHRTTRTSTANSRVQDLGESNRFEQYVRHETEELVVAPVEGDVNVRNGGPDFVKDIVCCQRNWAPSNSGKYYFL